MNQKSSSRVRSLKLHLPYSIKIGKVRVNPRCQRRPTRGASFWRHPHEVVHGCTLIVTLCPPNNRGSLTRPVHTACRLPIILSITHLFGHIFFILSVFCFFSYHFYLTLRKFLPTSQICILLFLFLFFLLVSFYRTLQPQPTHRSFFLFTISCPLFSSDTSPFFFPLILYTRWETRI